MADDPAGGDGFKAITTQEELNHVIGERVARAEKTAADKAAAQFADYDDLKAKAAQFDKAAEASKTEADKTAERIAKLEKENADIKSSALRTSIAAEYGVSTKKAADGGPSDAELFLTATDEATLRKQAERLAGTAADRTKKTGNRDPFAGRTPSTSGADDEMREFARTLFGQTD